MKKLLIIFVLAAIYVTPASSTTNKSIDYSNENISIVSDTDEIVITPEEDEKDKKKKAVKKTSSCCPGKATAKTGCSEAQKKSCAASKVSCSETAKKEKDKK